MSHFSFRQCKSVQNSELDDNNVVQALGRPAWRQDDVLDPDMSVIAKIPQQGDDDDEKVNYANLGKLHKDDGPSAWYNGDANSENEDSADENSKDNVSEDDHDGEQNDKEEAEDSDDNTLE